MKNYMKYVKIMVHGFCYNLLYFIINYVKNTCILIANFVIFL